MDRWILSRLEATVREVTEGIEGYSFGVAISALYDFTWKDFCDWYLESVKGRLRDGDLAARSVSLYVLDVLLRLLHPFMPFVSEELWHRLPGARDYLVRSEWPEPDSRFRHQEAEARVAQLILWIEDLRRDRVASKAAAKGGWLQPLVRLADEERELVAALASVELVDSLPGDAMPTGIGKVRFPAAQANGSGLERELERLRKELARSEARLANRDFVSKAPPAVVDKERARQAELQAALSRLGG